MNEPQVSFFNQLSDFLRRNLSVFLAAGLVLLLIQDVFGTHGVLAMRRAQKQVEKVRQEIGRIDTENRQLQNNVKALKSDPQTIEHIAREEMGLARPGEYIFKIPPKSSDLNGAAPAAQASQARPQP